MRRVRTQRQSFLRREREMVCTEMMASAVFRLGALWAIICCGASRADTLDSSYSSVDSRNRASESTGSLFDGLGKSGSFFSGSSLSGGFVGPSKTSEEFSGSGLSGGFFGSALNGGFSGSSLSGGFSGSSLSGGFSGSGLSGGFFGSALNGGFSGSSLSGGFSGSSKIGNGFSRPSLSGGFQGLNNLNLGFSGSLHSSGFLGSKQGGLSSFSGRGQLGPAALNLQHTLPREYHNLASNFFNSGQVLHSRFANQKSPPFISGSENTNSNIFSNNHPNSQSIVLASRGLGLKSSVVQSSITPSFISAQSNSIFKGKSNGGLLQRQNAKLSGFGGSSSNFGSGSFSSHGISTGLPSKSNIQEGTNLGFGLSSGSNFHRSGQTSTFYSGVGNRNGFSGGASQFPRLPTSTKLVAAGSGYQFVQYPSGFDTGRQYSNPGVGFLPGKAATSSFVGGIVGSGNTENLFRSAGAGVLGSTAHGSPFASKNIGTFGTRNNGNHFGLEHIGTFDSGDGNKHGSEHFGGPETRFSGTLSASGGANRLGLTRFSSGSLSSNKNLSGTFVGDRKYSG